MNDGLPIRLDPTALPLDPKVPSFISRPEGAPVYYGFEIIPESEKDGWLYGAITDYETADTAYTEGDGFVVAPDGSRAGVAWATYTPDFYEICPPDNNRWGVYGVRFPDPVRSKEDLIRNFHAVLPYFVQRFRMVHT